MKLQKFLWQSCLLWSLGLFSSICQAKGFSLPNESAWILSGGMMGSVDSQKVSSGNSTNINASALVGHSLGSDYEVGVAFDYLKSSIGNTVIGEVYDVWGELLYIGQGKHADAFYLGLKVGSGHVDNGVSTTDSVLYGGVIGKRFPLFGAVSYDPNFSVIFSKSDVGTSNPDYRFVPVQLMLIL